MERLSVQKIKEIQKVLSQRTALREVFIKHKVDLAYLFGSFAALRPKIFSDIDIAVYFSPDISELEYDKLHTKIFLELAAIFKTDAIDLIILNTAPPLLGHRIVFRGSLIFSSQKDLRIFVEDKFRRFYEDTKHFRIFEIKKVLERVKAL